MSIRPLGDRVVIKKAIAEEKTKSGIVLPGSAKEKPQMAEVVAIGSGVENDEKTKGQLSVGDKVLFSQYAGSEVKMDGEEYTVLKIADILAVIE
ncbi:10 kDa chaperonin [Andreesenia angusta]|uniref:Co-chaperonin GroES n=1 Tax=Andreesenia angusta TaxID=39480 RepID=A0A1S1V678_9FIRM|nr:co-chaperone GroES [Andreesenia angusta]OHW61607.1 10 kDa chaperonin [Andreesenia angusta]